MTRHNNTPLITILLLALIICVGCKDKKHKEAAVIYDYLETDGFTRADSIVNAISDYRDYQWMLEAIDSLNDRGELSRPKYIFYRTITLNMLNQQSTSLKMYYQLDTLDLKTLKTETDVEAYVYTYNNYIRMLCDMRRYDRALHEISKADARLKSIGYTTFAEHHDIAFYASALNISPVYLSRVVRQIAGRTVIDYINQHLLIEASYLLRTTSLSIAQIADQLHFADTPSFSKFFSRKKGVTPKEYRKQR